MSNDKLILSNFNSFPYKPTGKIPDPPIFNVKGLKYTVPPYYSFNHSETQWLINMIKSNNWDRIFRVVNSNPCYLVNTYCQYPDSPEPQRGQPMFHRKAILYLTPLAFAIYFNQYKLVAKMTEFVDDQGDFVVNVNQVCYVTNYLERFENRNDIMVIYPFCILFRRECFECVRPLLKHGWCPHEPIELPYRRIFQIFIFNYKDIVEYCLAQMATRPNLRLSKLLQSLIECMNDNFTLLKFEKIIYKDEENKEFTDMVSIPRRLLKYSLYFDKDMRLSSQIISCLNIINKSGFYIGPRRDSFDITFEPPKMGSDEDNVINDQDNSIALILALCHLSDVKGHNHSRDKLLDVLCHILVDTKWFVHFFAKEFSVITEYFSNLTEKIDPLKNSVIELVRSRMAYLIEICEINIRNIEELYNPEFPKSSWQNNLQLYLENNTSKNNEDKGNEMRTDSSNIRDNLTDI